MQKISAKNAEQELDSLSSTEKAKLAQRFFKTGKGEYGEGDQFLGITSPELRKLARQYQTLPITENAKRLKSKWHEVRAFALIVLVHQYQLADTKSQKKIYRHYIRHKKWINNWDLVDVSAPSLSGHYFYHTQDKQTLFQLAKSKRMWDRRIAVVSTLYHIRQNRFQEILQLSELLLTDQEDLMHKACGWMLREVGKRDQAILCKFLNKNAAKMPRTMLRYAIEKFSQVERQKFMQMD